MRSDPRYYQISILSFLLAYGLFVLDFEVQAITALVILLTAQLTQFGFTRYLKLPKFDPRSALISSLSLCLLLRTETLAIAALAAFIAVGSKFVIRWNGKHIFNPTNFSIVVMIYCFDSAWVSSGQWGRDLIFLLSIACLGMLVINRSRRSDITFAFLFFFATMLFGRALWLGDPLTVPLHQLQNGALLIFAFFMISDPMTTPNSRPGRILFALLVTLGAGFVKYFLFEPNGLLYSLVACCLFTPFIDRLLPGEKFQWRAPSDGNIDKHALSNSHLTSHHGVHYEKKITS